MNDWLALSRLPLSLLHRLWIQFLQLWHKIELLPTPSLHALTTRPFTLLIRGMAILPQGNQELLVVRHKVGSPQVELEVSKSMECDISFSALTLLAGRQEGHSACKKLDVGLLVVMI